MESTIVAILEALQMKVFLHKQVFSSMPVLAWLAAGATLELLLSGTLIKASPTSAIVPIEASSSYIRSLLWYLLGLVPLIIELILRRGDTRIRLAFHGSSGMQRIDCSSSEGLTRMRLGVQLQDPVTLLRERNGGFDRPETMHARLPHLVKLANITLVVFVFLSPPSILLASVLFAKRYTSVPDHLE